VTTSAKSPASTMISVRKVQSTIRAVIYHKRESFGIHFRGHCSGPCICVHTIWLQEIARSEVPTGFSRPISTEQPFRPIGSVECSSHRAWPQIGVRTRPP